MADGGRGIDGAKLGHKKAAGHLKGWTSGSIETEQQTMKHYRLILGPISKPQEPRSIHFLQHGRDHKQRGLNYLLTHRSILRL